MESVIDVSKHATEIKKLDRELVTFLDEGPKAIQTKEEQVEAESWVVQNDLKIKQVDAFFSAIKKPIKAALKVIDDQHKKSKAPLLSKKTSLASSLRAFRLAESQRLQKEQAKLNKQYDTRVNHAIAKGKDPYMVKPPGVVQAQQKTNKTEGGSVTYRAVKKLHILDESLIPEGFWIFTKKLDLKFIEGTLRSGRAVPGATLIDEEEMAVKPS